MNVGIFWAGDSTAAHNSYLTYPQAGIAQVMGIYTKEDVEVHNHAVNGRSTKSFIDEARLAAIYNQINQGDFLFIQFGHNDEKKEDPSRFTEAWGEFGENLERFVNVARNKKAYPVFITPLYRRLISETGELKTMIHLDYPAAMMETGKRLQVPVIDLCGMSESLLRRTPFSVTKQWYMNLEPGKYPSCPSGQEDNTHLTWQGAVIFAGLIAKGLKGLGGIYEMLLQEPENLRIPLPLEP